MPPSSATVADRAELDLFLRDDIQAELHSLRHLSFYGDMHGPRQPGDNGHEDQPFRSNARNSRSASNEESNTASGSQMAAPYFPGPHGAPPQVPPETYNYLIRALLSLQGSASQSYPQNYPETTYPYPIPSGPVPPYNYGCPPVTAQSMSNASVASSRSMYPSDVPIPLPPPAVSQSMAGPSQLTSSPAAPQTVPTTQDSEQTDEAVSIAEDKRRRNTAASARFRIKKKMKTLNLERTVADLTGRTEELEREATDLRRENAWLKEIVLLKGRNLTGLSLGSQASGGASRHEEEEVSDDDTPAEPDSGPSEKRGEKGKEKET